MDELEFLRKLGECNDKEQMQRLSEEYNNGHKPMTNADRIRAMSDEELEEFIRAISLCYEPWCDHHCAMKGDDNCNSCLAKWLKQPVEEVRSGA